MNCTIPYKSNKSPTRSPLKTTEFFLFNWNGMAHEKALFMLFFYCCSSFWLLETLCCCTGFHLTKKSNNRISNWILFKFNEVVNLATKFTRNFWRKFCLIMLFFSQSLFPLYFHLLPPATHNHIELSSSILSIMRRLWVCVYHVNRYNNLITSA